MKHEAAAGDSYHEPVLKEKVVELLRDARTVLDGTLGGGGHAEALLRAGVPLVVGVDRDPAAVAEARRRLGAFESAGRFVAVQANYAEVDALPQLKGLAFSGVLLDLGVSSRQLDDDRRGFTFRRGAVLDMRMGDTAQTAAELLNQLDETSLARVFRDFADEPRAARLAREITRRRAREAFSVSDDLVNAIRAALGPRTGPADFARIFQAVRIAVNDELEGLEQALPALRERLDDGGVMVVITYHSAEDRLVKHAFRDWSASCVCPPRQPRCTCRGRSLGQTLTRRGVKPGDAELACNTRARSATLRAWRKVVVSAPRVDVSRS